jgi:hypothetical protein
MLDPMPGVHDEMWAPDGRYALLVVLACALFAKWLWRRVMHRAPASGDAPPTDARVLAALACGFAVTWILWLATSGNSRYFIPMACVCSVLVVGLLPWVVGARRRVWVPVLAAWAALQLLQICMNPGVRWSNAFAWDDGPWLKVDVPERLRTEPALYLSMGALSNSFLAAYLAPQSAFINFTGSYALGPDGPGGPRIDELMRRYAPHLRLLASGDRLYTDLKHVPNLPDADGALSRFGLRVDPEDCATIALTLTKPTAHQPPFTGDVITCGLVPDSTYRAALAPAEQQAAVILDRLEDACPELFQPRRPVTEYRNHRWLRAYINTDVFAWVSRGWVKVYNGVSGDGPIFVGRDSDWSAAPQRVACGRRGGHDFIRIVPAAAQ